MKKSELRRLIKEELQHINEVNAIKTGELTINSKVLAKAKEVFPSATKYSTKNVPHLGKVVYVSDKSGKSLGHIYIDKSMGGAVISIKELEEMTGTAATPGYNTPNAFSSGKKDDERRKKNAEQLGYKMVNENRWLELKREESSPTQKFGRGISNIKKQLSEIETFINWYSKIKTEGGVNNEDYWKRTQKNLHSIRERLMNISEKIRKL